MPKIDLANIIVAFVSGFAMWATQKTIAKASSASSIQNIRAQMEQEAYERARAYDTETIKRQAEEIKELQLENKELKNELKALRSRVQTLEAVVKETGEIDG